MNKTGTDGAECQRKLESFIRSLVNAKSVPVLIYGNEERVNERIDESDKNDDDESEEQVKIIKREILIEGLYPTLVKRDNLPKAYKERRWME